MRNDQIKNLLDLLQRIADSMKLIADSLAIMEKLPANYPVVIPPSYPSKTSDPLQPIFPTTWCESTKDGISSNSI